MSLADAWDVAAVGRWLGTTGFEDLAPRFAAEEIDGAALLALTAEELQLLKLPMGRAKKLLEHISELKSLQRVSHPRATWSAGDAVRLPTLTSSADASERDHCEVILLMGPPASGKSTLGRRLATILGAEHFDLGEELRGAEKRSEKQPESLLLNFLMAQMVKGKEKAEKGLSHMILINGYPRMMDGFAFWEELVHVVKPCLVLVLEAPDDVLKARMKERARTGEEDFDSRLLFYRNNTEQVITAFHDTGRTRYIDATPGMEFVEASALFHLQASVVFACGNAWKMCEEVIQLGLPYMVTYLHVGDMKAASSAHMVEQILSIVRTKPGQVVLLTGFPRNAEDLRAWRAVEVLLVLDFESGMDFSGYFVRRFTAADGARNSISMLLRSCQPLHVAAPYSAAVLVRNWMDAARYCAWWDPNNFERFQGAYHSYMKTEVGAHGSAPAMFVRPGNSPTFETWLVWLTHLLHGASYNFYCYDVLQRNVAPLPAPLSSSFTKHLYIPRKAVPAARHNLGLDSHALASAPIAFVDAFASLHNTGLSPLSDPRALFFGAASHHGSVANDLLKLLGLYYRRFLIVMGEAGEDSKAGPSAEIDWIWHAHTTHSAVYNDDCRRLFGHVMPHIPCKKSDAPPKGTPKDDGQVAMGELNQLMRGRLQAFAAAEKTKLEKAMHWEYREKDTSEDDVVTLGCFIPGGDREWLSSKLRGISLGEAFASSLKDPGVWECPHVTTAMVRDPNELDVIVQLLSGETLFEQVMSKDTKIGEIERLLRAKGEREDLKFFVNGTELAGTVAIGDTDVTTGSIINVVRMKKPKPRPKPVAVRRAPSSDSDDIRCTCFTNSCIFQVLKNGQQLEVKMSQLKEGDLVHTGSDVLEDRYRRITRIWSCPVRTAETVELSPGCRLTTGHPVFVKGQWRRPESLGHVQKTFESAVYTIELEGHVDTVLVGSILCAALGVYCGESFGWNIFTRKTRPCDTPHCKKCHLAVIPHLNFATVTPDMLETQYPPY